MKRAVFLSMILFSSLLLVSCGNILEHNDLKENTITTSSSDVSVTTHNRSTQLNEQEYLRKAAWDLEEKFNTDGQTMIKTEINYDVADDTSDGIHSEIIVTVIDEISSQLLEEIQNSIDSNKASEEYKSIIYKIQLNIEEVAKTLKNDNDVIIFLVPLKNGTNLAIAKSNKIKNIIPFVM